MGDHSHKGVKSCASATVRAPGSGVAGRSRRKVVREDTGRLEIVVEPERPDYVSGQRERGDLDR